MLCEHGIVLVFCFSLHPSPRVARDEPTIFLQRGWIGQLEVEWSYCRLKALGYGFASGGGRSGGGAAMSAANSSSTPFLWSAACLAVALQWRPSDDQLTL